MDVEPSRLPQGCQNCCYPVCHSHVPALAADTGMVGSIQSQPLKTNKEQDAFNHLLPNKATSLNKAAAPLYGFCIVLIDLPLQNWGLESC